ncbi:glycosyltransferase family 2 protein [Pedobacter frigiditerrae]|uniref:glycosyltransferase family 2 protein n=1 Tax=Pedobacter frigiditerrae TaxID=2530452 RepID=UPI00292EEF99|nr:glycosyltransferase family 2 protein [Pedobacter frigiditerrae]
MDNGCLFSIIIPTFNSAAVVAGAIESILKQSFSEYEVLIIDGKSNDTTVDIANSYNDDRIKVFSEKDNGIYDAMNKGVSYATGKWLLFLGSDDELHDEQVLSEISPIALDGTKKLIYGNVVLVGKTIWGEDGQVFDGEFSTGKLLVTNISHQAIFYQRSIFEECGPYNLKYKICADYDFNLRVAAKHQLYYVDIIVAKFNAGGASTSQKDEPFVEDFYDNVFEYFDNSLMRHHLRIYDYQYFAQGEKKIRNKQLFKGLRIICIELLSRIKNIRILSI